MLKTLEEEGRKEQEKIIAKAKERAKAIMDKAKKEAEEIKQGEIDNALIPLSGERAKLLNDARLHVKKEVIQTKEEGVRQVYQKVQDKLAKLHKSSDYPKLFERMIKEATKGINGQVEIQVCDKDADLAKKILTKLKIKANLKGGLDSLGGLVLKTSQGKVVIHNTLESRMEKAKQYFKADLMQIIYEEK